jgi:MFS family permease
MKKRVYVLLPDEPKTDYCVGFLLACGLSGDHFRVIGSKPPTLSTLAEANIFEKSKILSGLLQGIVGGALMGLSGALLVILFPPATVSLSIKELLTFSALTGAIIGAVFSTIIASQIPKDYFVPFRIYVDRGAYLLLLEVPNYQIALVQELVQRVCPECVSGITDISR